MDFTHGFLRDWGSKTDFAPCSALRGGVKRDLPGERGSARGSKLGLARGRGAVGMRQAHEKARLRPVGGTQTCLPAFGGLRAETAGFKPFTAVGG
jgi:hypothetical protein